MKSMVEKMMMMPRMHAIEMPFANFWGPVVVYLCACVLCVSVVSVFLFVDKFVPQNNNVEHLQPTYSQFFDPYHQN